MIRPRGSLVAEHGDYCSLNYSGERRFSSEDLRPTQTDEYLKARKWKKISLTSQASMPNVNMSVTFVVHARGRSKACGSMSSGAIPQNNLSDSTSDQLAGRESAKAEPKPPRRATLSLSTRTFF